MVLKAMGNAISKAVTVAEILKHRVEHLHQITQIGSIETVDVYEPLEEGLDRIETKRHIPSIAIQLSLDPLNRDDPGYQSPIPVELVTKGFDDKEPRRLGSSARRKKKKSKAAASGSPSSPSKAVVVHNDDDDDNEDESGNGAAAIGRANAAASPLALDERGESDSPVAVDGKPAAREEPTKRGRGTRGGRGASRKLREGSSNTAGGNDNAAASDETKAAVSPSEPSTNAPKKASRARKPRAKYVGDSNGDASNAGAVERGSPEPAQLGSEGDDGDRSSASRGRGRGRGGRTGRGRTRGRGGRGDTVSSDAAGVPVAAE